uniref:Lipoprotein n=1 Tax=Colwellia sp. C1 TaxID=1737566 RepID=A0A0P0LXR8_9GAMM|nr:hypothetical protein [Colwellia sp. C1]
MKNIIVLPLFTSLLFSGCSSVTEDLNIDTTEYITHFRCYNKEKTTEHYLVNQFNQKPSIEDKRCEMVLTKRRIEKQLKIELFNCQMIPAKDVPDDLHEH